MLVTLPEEGHIAVFEQVDNTEYALESLGRRDNIDLPFVPDPDVVACGKPWLCGTPRGFYRARQRGKALARNRGVPPPRRPHSAVLERGALARPLDQRHLAAPKKAHRPSYELRDVEGKEYLFMEWKMGNYVFGGKEPSYYVLERA